MKPHLLLTLFLLLGLAACNGRQTTKPQPSEEQPAHEVKLPLLPPEHLTRDERIEYMRAHYWDPFDFGDTLRLTQLDTLQMLEVFATYVAQYVTPQHPEAIDSLMQRASTSRPMFEYFRMLAEQVLYNPNSPLRNDELYIPVLQATLRCPWLDSWERISPEEELRLAMQNRRGTQANDFEYELLSGQRSRLYDLRADYTLLLFSDPECPMCRQIVAELSASPRINELTERNALQIIVIAATDSTDWKAHADTYPQTWIYARDPDGSIVSKGLYDLKAIPSLYLLDGKKRVLVKDSISIPEIEEALDRHAEDC